MMHAWRNARTATARCAVRSAAAHSDTLLSLRAGLSALPLPLLARRGFASKNPFGRGGVARAESPWGSNNASSNRATNAAHTQQQHQPQHTPRNERSASRERDSQGTRNSASGARGAWSTRRDGAGSSSSSGSGGKKHYQPRRFGAAAAAANPRPKTDSRSATNANGPAWAPVAAKFAEATAWTPAPPKAWSRGGGSKSHDSAAPPPPSSSVGAQSWARSAARRERSHGAPLPDLSVAPAPTQPQPPPAGSHKRGSRPTAEGRSAYRHGGERDARSKMRERERFPSARAPSLLSDPSSPSPAAAFPRAPPRSFADTAELEEDTAEHVEATNSAQEFWTHFPAVHSASNNARKGAATTASETAVPQRLVPPPVEPEQYKPVFLNHPASSPNAAAGGATADAAAPSRPRSSPARVPASKTRGSELSELMGSTGAIVSLNRSTLRLGVLLPEAPQDIGFIDPEAPPPSEADRALESFHAGVRARIEGMSQELATATGAELVTHPLHVDMCAEYVPMDRADVTGGVGALAAPAVSSASPSLPPEPLLVLQLFESSIRHAPNSHRGHLRIRADASTSSIAGSAAATSGVRGTALKGQGFFPSFFNYFKHAAARVQRDANEAKLMARNAMIRAVGWKPTQDAAATEDAEEEEVEEEGSEAAEAEAELAESKEADAAAATVSSAAASDAPSKTPNTAATGASKTPSRRLRLRNVSAQLPQPLAGLTVMDATAGFGVDAFALAMSGATVHAYESFPLFQTLLRQAFDLIRRSPAAATAGAKSAQPQALDGRLQFVLDRITLHEADALSAMRGEESASAASPPMPRPDVVYLDLYPPGTSLSPAALPFRVSIRARYLRLLCERPSPAEVDTMLSAALAVARSHVVMKFPSVGEHYRPGDAVPGATTEAAAAAREWEVARIYKHKHMQSDFVVYRRKSS